MRRNCCKPRANVCMEKQRDPKRPQEAPKGPRTWDYNITPIQFNHTNKTRDAQKPSQLTCEILQHKHTQTHNNANKSANDGWKQQATTTTTQQTTTTKTKHVPAERVIRNNNNYTNTTTNMHLELEITTSRQQRSIRQTKRARRRNHCNSRVEY